jgi:Xaa-Pro dipeptidase
MLPDMSYAAPEVPELRSRIDRVLRGMAEARLDHFVLVDPDNVYWLTNFANFVHERPFVLVVSSDGRLRFVVPKLEIPHVRIRAVGDLELVPYFEFPAPEGERWSDIFTSLIRSGERVGIEATCPQYVHVAIAGTAVVSDLVEEARFIKSDYEIARIRYACDIATVAMDKLLRGAKPGKSMIEVSFETGMYANGRMLGDNPKLNVFATRVSAVVQPPAVSHDPHNFTDLMALKMEAGGPNVSIVAGRMNGYGAEIERTFFLGEVPVAARGPFETMIEARHLAFEMCKPGVSMHDVDAQVNAVFRNAGYGDKLLHRTGHGIGVTAHEGPFLAEGYRREIQPGMVFTIEPGLYIEGVGGFRHSDTVLVTEGGNISLTQLPDNLDDMTTRKW